MPRRKMRRNDAWPVLRHYDQDHLDKIALPLGGIGTGTLSLGGRGDLRDWEVVNRPAKGFSPRHSFFALWARPAGGQAVTRCLQGPIPYFLYEGTSGAVASNHGLPPFRQASFDAAYPLGQVHLSDPLVPLEVRLEAFNPLIPGDPAASSIPVAVLRYVLTNRTGKTVHAAVCGNVENFIGRDGSTNATKDNRNQWQTGPAAAGILMRSHGLAPTAETWGTMALATTATRGLTFRTAWADVSWGDTLLDYWDDFSADGKLQDRERGNVQAPMASLSVALTIPPRASREVTFLIAWHYPNRMTWTPKKPADGQGCGCSGSACADPNCVGNHYATQYADAWDVVQRSARDLKQLEADTVSFVRAVGESSLPEVVKEAALFNLSTLRSQTTFRIADGHVLGWEGCGDKQGCCHGSCTHVWNYEQATAFLFADLARSMRDIEFGYCVNEAGKMSFRADLPLKHAKDWETAAADGQMGCLVKLYREWKLSADKAFLEQHWPAAKRAMSFAWVENGWDGDRDGVMEGCQHNTMDVEYYGPNPQMQGWYLAALAACEQMALAVGDGDFAQTCRRLFAQGRQFMDEKLFNGDYYEHEIRPIADAARIAPGLRHSSMGARNLAEPDLQLGAGCLIDQLVGQFAAHCAGLGYLHAPAKVVRTLQSIRQYNSLQNFWGHFNHMRSFVLQEEQAVLMCTYPKGRRPQRPFPYYNEVMTGFEYVLAVGMLFEGLEDEAVAVIQAIRDRYDGRKRSPFDEAECGHHYARALASWGAVVAIPGFDYSAVEHAMTFAARPGCWFWSNGSAWGTCTITHRRARWQVQLRVFRGALSLQTFTLRGLEGWSWPTPRSVTAGRPLQLQRRG